MENAPFLLRVWITDGNSFLWQWPYRKQASFKDVGFLLLKRTGVMASLGSVVPKSVEEEILFDTSVEARRGLPSKAKIILAEKLGCGRVS